MKRYLSTVVVVRNASWDGDPSPPGRTSECRK